MKKPSFRLPESGSKKTLQNGAYGTVFLVVVLAAVILVNLVVRAVPTKYTEFDISTGEMFTLSDTTKALLHELDADVTAYYLAETGSEDANITRLLDRYAGESSRFDWQQKDPVLYPTFANSYDGAQTGSVVLVCGENYKVVSYSSMYSMDLEAYYSTGSATYTYNAENELTSALSQVTRTASYVIYELSGHGELELESDFTETLENGGVTTDTLNLTTAGSVPEDAAVILINVPVSDLTSAELTILQEYVENGGKLLIATDFTVETPNLDALLASAGLSRQAGMLIETDSDYYPYGYPVTYLLPKVTSNEATSGVPDGVMVFAPLAQGIVEAEDSEYSYLSLLSTSSSAYSMENYANAEVAEKADTDPEGAFDLAAAAYNDDTGARIVWLNCPNILSASVNQAVSGGNAKLLGSIVNWFTGEQTTAVIDGKSMSAESLSVPARMVIVLGLLFTVVLPLACIITGVVVCLVRRRR